MTHNSGNSFTFFMWNQQTDDSISFGATDNGYNGSTADFVAERPLVNGVPTNLSNFGNMAFRSTTNGQPIGNYNNFRVSMIDGSTNAMAVPSALKPDKQNFTVQWKRCN